MNARTHTFELSVEGRQADEVLASIFHTVLFHRTLGKFIMGTDNISYNVGSIGFADIDCNFIDFTYVCCSSPSLDLKVKRAISEFSSLLRANESTGTGQISLEFFQRQNKRWPLRPECVPWEVWTVRLELVNIYNENDRQICRERVSESVAEKVGIISETINGSNFLPRLESNTELTNIFDTTLPDVQPYLFKFNNTASSFGTTFKKLFQETLSL